jgi:hypothetical protein
MQISRRDFMKLVGVSVASLTVTHCQLPLPVACYAPAMPPSLTPTIPPTARDILRQCWMSFGELAQAVQVEFTQPASLEPEPIPQTVIEGVTPTPPPNTSNENSFGQELSARHRQALDELVASGELTPAVAGLVQEAYDAAVYHVWRSNAPITCYEPYIVDFAPSSAGMLVQQADTLTGIAAQGNIDPATLEKAQAALEHDLAFYAMTQEEIDSLYQRLIDEWQSQQQSIPQFDQVDLQVTPEARTAAKFILDLLTQK